jgi:inner membrane protein
LILGANLPDLDILAYLDGPAADLEWRRGWTHGILALAVLPFLLTGSLLLLHRVIRSRRSGAGSRPLVPPQLLLLSFIATLSHPILDTLNTYGMRWLMPFSGTWYYGDALFIVDPWVWTALALGMFFSRRREKARQPAPGRPAQLALIAVAAYAIAMTISGIAARSIIRGHLESLSGKPIERMMAAPLALDPRVRRFVVEQAGEYRVGSFNWLNSPRVARDVLTFGKGQASHPAVLAAGKTDAGRRFLLWARFPAFTVEQILPGQYLVHMVDVRYAERPGATFGALSIPVAFP